MAKTKRGTISERKLWILWCIDQFVHDCGRSPTYREIISTLGLTDDGESAVYHHMNAMFDEGWIDSEIMEVSKKRRTGTIRLTAMGRTQLELPANQALLALQSFYQARTAVRAPAVQAEPRRQAPRAHAASYVVLDARITGREPQVVHIPVLSLIAASFGAEMPSSDYSLPSLGPEEKIAIQEEILPRGCNVKDLYALEVRGDSMVGAGIQSGDYVIVKPTQTAENGDLCVLWIDQREATLKFFYREEKRVRLVPANPKMPPRTYGPRHKITVQGKVVQVVRCGR